MEHNEERRHGLTMFTEADAVALHETGMMSMPEIDPAHLPTMMEWGMSPGHNVKVLYGDPNRDGMSLVWSWFGPGFILPRHSHSADCLYYVVKGSLKMGNQELRAGEGFFVPCDGPYAYTAGPEGVEVLEFRDRSSFDMKITESADRWAQIAERARHNSAQWAEIAARIDAERVG